MKKLLLAQIIASILAVLCSFIVIILFITLIGENPLKVTLSLWNGILEDKDGILNDLGYILYYTTTLILSGLAVAFAFRGGLFNIGGQGQIIIGSFLCAVGGFTFKNLPSFLLIPFSIFLSALGGAIWALIPGILKAKRGSHEVINTIMLNFIAIAITDFLVNNIFKSYGQTPQTEEIAIQARIPRFSELLGYFGIYFPKSVPLNLTFLLALLMIWATYYILFKTKYGYEIRAVGYNKDASFYGGINVSSNIILTMMISGILYGLVGVDFILGYQYRFRQDVAISYSATGFLGIAVSLLGQNHPFGIFFSALLFGTLSHMGILFELNTSISKDIILILQGIIIIFVVSLNEIFKRKILSKRKKDE